MTTTPETEFSFRDLLRVFDRRRKVLLGTAGAIFLTAVLVCIFMTRRYEARGVFELQKSSSDALDLTGLMGGSVGGASDSLSLNVDMQTQVQILKSDTLALKVIEDLNLQNDQDFRPHFNPVGYLMGMITPKGPQDPAGVRWEDSPRRRAGLLKAFADHLTVKATAGTRLIEVDFSSRDPKVASKVVNHLIQALIDYTFQTKFAATNQISEWLENQLGDLRKQTESLQSRVVALQQGSGIFGVGGTDLQGKPVVYSPVLDRLQQSSMILSQAEMNRVIKESIYKVAKSGNAEMLSQLSGTGIAGQSSQGIVNSLNLIQSLRSQEATIQAQIGQDASQFGPNYPKLIEERASLQSVENSLQEEIDRIAMRAKNDYDISVQTERGAKGTYEKDRSEAEKLNDKTIEYAILSRESEQSQVLYQDLLKRLKEAGILEGLHSSNLTIVDSARPPAKPNKPNVPLYLMMGVFMGAFLGGGAALLAEAIDNKIQGTEEIEQMQLHLLGIVPEMKSFEVSQRPSFLDTRSSDFNEAIRGLRSTLLVARSGTPPKVILVTSGGPGEGKSTIALNLAAALAQYNKRVLLVEADMRRPVLKVRLNLSIQSGLSTVLADTNAPVQVESLPEYPNLYILPAGPVPPYPSELLGAAPLDETFQRWSTEYDFIVIDTPPILAVTDTQLLMPVADSTVLVARANVTTKVGLLRAYKLLFPHAKNPAWPAIGVLLNGISTHSAAYYGYYGHYGYRNYYRQDGE